MSLLPPEQDGESLDLTIRFSASLPDLLLSLPYTARATTATLKHEIRARLPEEYSKRRIRLIYSGKALADEAPLAGTLKRPSSHAASRSSTPLSADPEASAKGKAAVRDPPSVSRIYIHCSIGDVVLSSAELSAEAALARSASPHTEQPRQASTPDTAADASTAPAARGFDRLLSAGFSPSEVQNLRLQFLAIQAHTHTSETMPDPSTLRDMEDTWLDSSESAGTLGASLGGDQEDATGHLDDMIWGATMGFFWPVGCMLWAFREEGIWSRRRKMAVVIGMLINAGLGTVRWMG